jgi:uncharacterized protein YkvS
MEINQYPLESFAFQDEDYYDIDFWTGSGYQTKKILGSVIKAGILAAVENIYTASGVITGDREVNLGGNILNFISNDAGAAFIVNLGDLGVSSNSQFQQTLAQIFMSIVDTTTPDKDVQFTFNPINTTLVLNDGLNSCSLQITNVGSALNFTDGITQYRVEANENGVVINSSYILPNVDGTAGQVMTTDGAGIASWQDAATTTISWGDIVGNIIDQTDLQSALDAKADDNIYSADGTITDTRIVDLNGETIEFQDSSAAGGAFIVNIDNGTKLSSLALNPNLFDLELINTGVGSVIIGTSTDLLLRYIGAIANKQIKINNTGIQINEVYYLPNADGTNGQVIKTNGSGSLSFQSLPAEIQLAASDETTNLTIGTSKVTFRMPHAMTLTAVRASLSTAQAAGAIFTVDINQNGGSILGTKLTIDNNEKTSTTAATPATIVTSALTDDAEITIDIDHVGTALAKGLIRTLIGTRA